MKASLNRPNVPGDLLRQDTEETTALATAADPVFQAESNVVPVLFHQVLLSAGRLQETSGEPDKSISSQAPPQPRPQPPNIIEDDIATDLEEVLSFNPGYPGLLRAIIIRFSLVLSPLL